MIQFQKHAAEILNLAIPFTTKLVQGPASSWSWPHGNTSPVETLSGTPTAEEVGTSDLMIDDVAVNSTDRLVEGMTAKSGEAVQFTVAGGTSRSAYTIRVTATTSGDPAQTLVEDIRLVIL